MKNKIRKLCLAFCIMCAYALNGADGETSGGGDIAESVVIGKRLKDLTKLIEKVQGIQKRQQSEIDKLNKKLSSGSAMFENRFFYNGNSAERESKIIALIKEKGKPDDSWSDEKVEAFLLEYYDVITGYNSFSFNDLGVAVISDLGVTRVPVIIRVMTMVKDRPGNLFYFYDGLKAINLKDNQQARDAVINNLYCCPGLISVILHNKWVWYAKNEIIKTIKKSDHGIINTGLVDALASLNDKETYALMKEVLISSGNISSTYQAIKNLPGINLTKEIMAKAWRNTRNFDRYSFAPIAAQYGVSQALEDMINMMGKSADGSRYFDEITASGLYRLTEVAGTGDDYRKWYKENKAHLFFDSEKNKYIVDKTRQPQENK